MWIDFWDCHWKKYWLKIKLVLKCEYTFFTPWGKKFLACGKVFHFQFEITFPCTEHATCTKKDYSSSSSRSSRSWKLGTRGWCPPCLNHWTPDTCAVSRVCTSPRDLSPPGMYWTRLLTSIWYIWGISKNNYWNSGVSLFNTTEKNFFQIHSWLFIENLEFVCKLLTVIEN